MPDKTTYQSEMNTPAHKPGMQGVVNRGPQHAVPSDGDTRDSSGNRQGARRTVSAPTQSAFGAASKSDPPPPPDTPPKVASPDPLSIVGKTRDAQVSQIVDDASK